MNSHKIIKVRILDTTEIRKCLLRFYVGQTLNVRDGGDTYPGAFLVEGHTINPAGFPSTIMLISKYSVEIIPDSPPRHNVNWTEFEHITLEDHFDILVKDLALKFGRTEEAIKSQIRKRLPKYYPSGRKTL